MAVNKSALTVAARAMLDSLWPLSDMAKSANKAAIAQRIAAAGSNIDDVYSILQEVGLSVPVIESAGPDKLKRLDRYLEMASGNPKAGSKPAGGGVLSPDLKTGKGGEPAASAKMRLAERVAAKSSPSAGKSASSTGAQKVTAYNEPPGAYYTEPSATQGALPSQGPSMLGSTMGITPPESGARIPARSPERAALMDRMLAQSAMSGRGTPGRYKPPAGPALLPHASYGGAEMVTALPPHLQGAQVSGDVASMNEILNTPPGAAQAGAQLAPIQSAQEHIQKISDLTFEMGQLLQRGAMDRRVAAAMQRAGAPSALIETMRVGRSPLEWAGVPGAAGWIRKITGVTLDPQAPPQAQAQVMAQAVPKIASYIGGLEGLPKWWQSSAVKAAGMMSAAMVGVALAIYMNRRSKKKRDEMESAQRELAMAGMPSQSSMELQALMQLQGMGALGGGMPQPQPGSATQVTPGTLRISGARGE